MTFSKICRTCTYSIYRLGYMLAKMPIPFIVHSSHKSLQAKFRLRNQSKLAANWKQICSPKGCLKSATPTWLALTPLVKDEGAYASARVPHACHLAWNWNWSCRVKTASSAAASQPFPLQSASLLPQSLSLSLLTSLPSPSPSLLSSAEILHECVGKWFQQIDTLNCVDWC